ncbi:unnamed protein product [Moneuplotes crassus]|uniref:Uncharacterized protein n=1 Tax=Euplotes crassus TaxID=5936 RepID=A0AAD1XW06_EUPCR|nr:unnamed protein product [Moneuplotes crassus]
MSAILKIKKLFQKSTHLPVIINKARIFNTYASIAEIFGAIFFYAIPSQLNQSVLMIFFIAVSVLSIFGMMYIHMQSSGMFYKNSMLLNIVCHVSTITLIVFVMMRFYALWQVCNLVENYYSEIGESQPSGGLCIKGLIYYLSWIFVSMFFLTFLRLLSFYYMFKSFRYIKKREEDALKKKQRKMELSHRARKNRIRKEKLKKKNQVNSKRCMKRSHMMTTKPRWIKLIFSSKIEN